MPSVSEDNPNARYAVSVWIDDDSEEKSSYFIGREEAETDFEKLNAAGRYMYGAMYEWVGGVEEWRCLDSWPDDFDG